MIVVDLHQFERPRHLVLAFMAGLSQAAGFSARCYVDQLVLELLGEERSAAEAS